LKLAPFTGRDYPRRGISPARQAGQGWRFYQVEDYDVDLDGVTALELRIVPDISGGRARASRAQLRLPSYQTAFGH